MSLKERSSMRIGIDARFAVHNRRGIGNYTAKLICNLAEIDHRNEYLLYVDSTRSRDVFPEQGNFRIRQISPSNYPTWEQLMLPARARKDNIDILHSTGNTAPIYLNSRIKRVATIHDVMYLKKRSALPRSASWRQACGRFYRRMVVPRVVAHLSAVITVSDFCRREIARHLPALAADDITVIYEAGNEACRPIDKRCAWAEIRKKHGIANNYILTLGGIDPRKNTRLVMDKYVELRSKGLIDQKLVIVGIPNWRRTRFNDVVMQSGCRDDIILTDFLDDDELVLLYNCAAVFLYPSLYEGFGLPPLEAMACGTPVIASNITSIPEIVGDAAILIDPTDGGQLKKALLELLSNEHLRRQLISRGFRQARKFSWRKMAEQTLAVYESVYKEQQ